MQCSEGIILVVLLLLLSACTPIFNPPPNTGIEGQVLIGPLCPVVREGEPCPDKPFQATLTILDASGRRRIERFTTDSEGRFQVFLLPGMYVLHPETPEGMPLPVAPEQTIVVVEGQYTQVTVTYDSGIR